MYELNCNPFDFQAEYSTTAKRKPTSFEANIGEEDGLLLEFEKFVSKQKVSFFSEKMDISMLFSYFYISKLNFTKFKLKRYLIV